ncbi:PAS domain S-box protein [Oscillatoria sp. FACHB-1407]|uniref:PAS domain S-box protein n=1 Tax=Oscillatoria sp. FACHB-1407 TaxID=2692847 RepID=UPI00168401D9|nr:PAS domain S-box protein [Oscillatoria sp. FACHB-1407]MBD2462029.1 PAS domain S-box protein [Oscillatoria sp. FACHB-1407]
MINPKRAIALNNRRFSLRTLLVVPFVLQIVTAVGLVGWLSFLSGQKAVNEVATSLQTELAFRIQRELQGYFESPHSLNRLNSVSFVQGDIDFANAQNVAQFFQQVKISPYVDAVYCATQQEGTFLGVTRVFNEADFQIMLRNSETGGRMNLYSVDSLGNRRLFVEALRKYDARVRPWYKAAVQAERSVWSPVYLDFTTQLPTITASQPVYRETNGQLLGVCATDVILPKDFRNFLINLSIGESGHAFVIERSGSILSSSTDESLISGEGENAKLLQATNSSEPLIRETARQLQTQYGSFEGIQRSLKTEFILDGQRQFVQVLPFKDDRGIDWLIVVVVPESDFMGQIQANTRNTALLCAAALVGAIALGIFASHKISQPLLQVAQASEEIADGNLDQHLQPSSITEIERLSNSFNSMSGQLKDSFAALETKNEELRIAEENYRSIFQNALEGIFQASPNGHFINVNPAMARLYGYDTPEAMLNHMAAIGTQVYVNPESQVEFKRQLEQHGEVKNFAYQIYRQDGSIVWLEENTRAVRGKDGNLLYFEGIVEDITLRKREEEALKRTIEELRIEIDQKKLEQEVTRITESEYFKKLQDEVSNLHSDDV